MSSFDPVFLRPFSLRRGQCNTAESFPSVAGEFTSYLGSYEAGAASDVKTGVKQVFLNYHNPVCFPRFAFPTVFITV